MNLLCQPLRARLSRPTTGVLLAAALFVTGATAQASTRVTNACDWLDASGLSNVTFNVGDHYVPRDAPVGTIIGQENIRSAFLDGLRSYICHTDGSVQHQMSASATRGIIPVAFPTIGGKDLPGKVLRTNVDGIGVQISLRDPYDGTIPIYWHPNAGTMIPFDAYIRNSTEVLPQLGYLRAVATLYKTGDIEPGTNALNGEVASGSILRSIGRIWGINLAGSVTTSQCSGPISPVSAVPVDLGEWSVSDFTEPGATSEARRFTITLSDCIADPRTGGTITTAHIHLQPTGGSTTLDAEQGLLSLGDGSTATGLGIQMLMADGLTTVKLDREVSLRAIEPTGSTVLPFSARFVKQGERVTPGTAKGALGFTISYK